MRSVLQDHVDERRFSESDESEAPRAARLAVLHDDTVDDVTVAAEVPLQVLLGGLP